MFGLREISRFMGRPVQLVRFDHGPRSWGFTTGDVGEEVGGLIYQPSGITRSAVRETTEAAKNRLTITLPIALDPNADNVPPTQEFAALWRPFPPSGEVLVTCMAMHRGDGDAEVVVEWIGRVVQPEFTDTLLTLTCDNTRARHRVAGGGRRCQRACDLVVYGKGLGQCNLDPDAFAIPADVEWVGGLTVAAQEFADSAYTLAGGYVEWETAEGITERRTIMSHQNDEITLDYGAADLAGITRLTSWPGCAHNWAACSERGNTDNYGGFVHLPAKNPWSGNPP